jgi:hypothetical protein
MDRAKIVAGAQDPLAVGKQCQDDAKEPGETAVKLDESNSLQQIFVEIGASGILLRRLDEIAQQSPESCLEFRLIVPVTEVGHEIAAHFRCYV